MGFALVSSDVSEPVLRTTSVYSTAARGPERTAARGPERTAARGPERAGEARAPASPDDARESK